MDPTMLMALRAGRPEHTAEAEPVIVACHDERVALELDDGETLDLDRIELLAALGVPRAAVVALDAAREDTALRRAA